jgi:MIP family channel proteins
MDKGLKSWWAEFLGTFTLCLIGEGAICVHQLTGDAGSGLLPIAIAHGLALAVMISALGAASGGHFNPAVTFGFLVTGRQTIASAIAYWVSQLLGAVVASWILVCVFPASVVQAVHLGAPAIHPDLTVGSALLIEAILTFFLVTAVWGTAVDERAPKIGGFGIGLCVTMDILLGGPLTGAAMNPARAFGAAFIGHSMANHWVWWVGPMAGGALAALIYSKLILSPKS